MTYCHLVTYWYNDLLSSWNFVSLLTPYFTIYEKIEWNSQMPIFNVFSSLWWVMFTYVYSTYVFHYVFNYVSFFYVDVMYRTKGFKQLSTHKHKVHNKSTTISLLSTPSHPMWQSIAMYVLGMIDEKQSFSC